jgi:membrane associated rhomboid family serine protease/Zn-finger nucleic acid-binding protein
VRNCPRCHYPLREIHNGQVIVDHCGVCRGNFFDTQAVAPTWGKAANPQYWVEQNVADWKGNTGLTCPVDGERMDAWKLAWGKAVPVEVDVCPTCRGLWLDEHEGGRMVRVIEAHDDERASAEQLGWKSYLFQLFTGLPVEVWNPVRNRPWVLYGLIASLVAVFGWEAWVSTAFGERGEELVQFYALIPRAVMDGQQLHGIVTHAFLHGGIAHLLGNLYFLWVFGDNIEDRLGWQRFVAIYALTGLVAAAVQVLSEPSSAIPVLGASGAISGVTGAYFALFPRVKVRVVWLFIPFSVGVFWYFLLWVGLQVLSAYLGLPGVAWYAHIGGFVAGAALGALFRRPLKRRVAAS